MFFCEGESFAYFVYKWVLKLFVSGYEVPFLYLKMLGLALERVMCCCDFHMFISFVNDGEATL